MPLIELFAILVLLAGAATIVWIYCAKPRSRPRVPPKPADVVSTESVDPQPPPANDAAAQEQNRTTTAVAAWWWLNHESPSKDPPNDPKD